MIDSQHPSGGPFIARTLRDEWGTKVLTLALLLLCTLSLPAQTPATPAPDAPWWKHAVVYELYPRSFKDTNADGVGDLNGITQRLPYLEHLGVDAIWIAPMYPSPQVDFGYDISDYTNVDPQYGTLADFDRLVAAARTHHIRILLDMVLNHTSDQHAWFKESASSRTNPKADWYMWNDGKPATATTPNAHQGPKGWVVPPNNWSSLFQGSAWEWNATRGQFYYHFFYKQQPDLNWRNPAVEHAMFSAMRFWLDRGVAGFRLDAITTLFEVEDNRDEQLTGKLDAAGFPESSHILTSGLPEVHDVMRRLRTLVDSYSPAKFPNDRVLIGEIYVPKTAELAQWYGTPAAPELQLPMDTLVAFHEEGNGITGAKNVALNLPHFRQSLTEMQTQLGTGWPLLVFDNHDNTRSWDRFAPPGATSAQKLAIAKTVATMLLTSRSTALMYYGEELGMTTEVPTRKEDVRDPIGISGWPQEKGRDGERTPMQWDATPLAGFTTNAHPWLPIPANHATINVATESADPNSLLTWHQQLITLRRTNPALRDGSTVFLDNENPDVLTYVRTLSAKGAPLGVLVTVNMSGKPQAMHLDPATSGIKVLLTDAPELKTLRDLTDFTLPPYASLVVELK